MAPDDAETILREIESNPENYLIIGRIRGQILVRLSREFQPRRILEVGTNVGYSAILMGKELGPRSEIITIEANSEYAEKAKKNIQRANLQVPIKVLVGKAQDILPTLDGEFDLVFIDAVKDQYFTFLKLMEDKLYRGSLIVADNAGKSAHLMQDYLDYVRASGGYTSRFIPAGDDGVELSIKR